MYEDIHDLTPQNEIYQDLPRSIHLSGCRDWQDDTAQARQKVRFSVLWSPIKEARFFNSVLVVAEKESEWTTQRYRRNLFLLVWRIYPACCVSRYWDRRWHTKSNKNNKKRTGSQLQGDIRKTRINYFTRKNNKKLLNSNFQNNYGRHFFNIFPLTKNSLSKQISKSKIYKPTVFFFANRVKYFRNKLLN